MDRITKTKIYISMRRRALKRQCVEYKGGKCQKCGYNDCIAALEFHYRDHNEKDFGVSNGNSMSWEKIKEELNKCDMLCSNCHKKVHWLINEKEFSKKETELRKCTEIRKAKIRTCLICGKEHVRSKERQYHFCSKKCYEVGIERNIAEHISTKIEWPSSVKLFEMVQASSFREVGRELGVADNTIRKRLKKAGLLSAS